MEYEPEEQDIAKILLLIQESGISADEENITSITNNGDELDITLSHTFTTSHSFPALEERIRNSSDAELDSKDLSIGFQTSLNISMVSSVAGFNNTLGVYTVGEDGTIHQVELAYRNVKAGIKTGADYTYTLDSSYGTEAGFFIIANGSRINKNCFKDLDLENGSLEFVYDLGGENERLAKISDNAKEISLVYTIGEDATILKGHIYHTTRSDGTNVINPDNASHALAGLAGDENPDALRLGFEDLRNLGDADFNDVIFDVQVEDSVVSLPADILGNLVTGTDSEDILDGTIEDDRLEGKGGDDILRGSDGNDTLNGGDGIDTADYRFMTSSIKASLSQETAQSVQTVEGMDGSNTELLHNDTFNSIENITGSEFDDIISGDLNDNKLAGRNGDDIVQGGGGADLMFGGDGTDTLDYSEDIAGIHVDMRSGTATDGTGSTDTFSTFENIIGSSFDDHIIGDDLGNVIRGGMGADAIFARGGDDILYGEGDADTIYGSDGDDTIYGDDGDDTLYGNTGMDIIYGGAGIDRIEGNEEDDILYGEDGDDHLLGGAGNDTLNGGAGADLFNGEDGTDTLDYSLDVAGINVDMRFGTATDGSGSVDTYYFIENITGSAFDDRIVGDEATNIIRGGDGSDSIFARGGDDILYGEGGADTIYGSDGDDTIYGDDGDDTLYGNTGMDIIYGGAGIDRIEGNEEDDILYGEDGDDHLLGGAGNDTLNGGAGADLFNGEDGTDTLDYSLDVAGINVDMRFGTATDGSGSVDTYYFIENITGSAFDDRIVGDEASNLIRGGSGSDSIFARGGDDTISGGEGEDYIYGSGGADTFVLNSTGLDNRDWIHDFNAAEGDKLDISDILDGFDSNTGNINDYVELIYVASYKSHLFVNADGLGDDAQVAASFSSDMSGVTVDDLFNGGNLIV